MIGGRRSTTWGRRQVVRAGAVAAVFGLGLDLALTLWWGEPNVLRFGFWGLICGAGLMLLGGVTSGRLVYPGNWQASNFGDARILPPRDEGFPRLGLGITAGGAATFVIGIGAVLAGGQL